MPRVAKTHTPQRMQVCASAATTTSVSLRMGPWNRLYELNAIREPKAIPMELNTCAAAYTQT